MTLGRGTAARIACLAVALVLWLASTLATDPNSIGTFGLVQALPVAWFAALALVIGVFATAVCQRDIHVPTMIGATGVLILILHGTTALVYDEPRYVYVYKHFAVIDLIAQTGGVDRSVDIYNNWPGFFALNALLERMGGVSAADYANWAQVAFSVLMVLAARFALRGITKDERVVWVATWLFVLGNWVAQDYLAPQALGFVLALVVLGLCLRWERPGERPLRPAGTVAVGAVCYVAAVVSHQLTPIVLILTLGALALFTKRVPRWIPAAMMVVELAWVALAFGYLSSQGSPISFDVFSNARPPVALGTPAVGFMVTSWAARGVAALLVLLAAVRLWQRRGEGLENRTMILLVVMPAATVLGADYGGEGGLRGYLFALPWVALLGAELLSKRIEARESSTRFTLPGRPRARRAVAVGALTTLLAGGAVQASFGRELLNEMRPDDVAATRWFERTAPRGSALVTLTANAPYPISARYATLSQNDTKAFANVLTEDPAFIGRRLGRGDLRLLDRWVEGLPVRRRYIALTGSQKRDLELNRTIPASSVDSLERAMAAADNYRLVFRSGQARVFEWRP